MSQNTSQGGVVVHTPPLSGLSTTLFIQADPDQGEVLTPLLDRCGVGVVYTQKSTTRRWLYAAGPARYTLARSANRDVLLDAGRYHGTQRRLAAAGIDASWVRFQQHELDLPWAMADPGYCARGDLAGVETILRACEQLPGNVLVPLPLAKHLLIEDADKVRDLIELQNRPVALILEDDADPCAAGGVVSGYMHLLAGGAAVGLLRADTSVLGALAFGAPLVAFGARPGLRHIPMGGGPTQEHVSMLVPSLLSYKYAEHVLAAYAVDPDLAEWGCRCHRCGERGDVGWIPDLADPAPAALEHSVAAVAWIARELGTHPDPEAVWCKACKDAQAAHFVLGDGSEVWKPKPFLRRWADLAPTRVGA